MNHVYSFAFNAGVDIHDTKFSDLVVDTSETVFGFAYFFDMNKYVNEPETTPKQS